MIRYLPYGMRYVTAGVLQIHPELEEAAASRRRLRSNGTPTHRHSARRPRLRRLVVHLPNRGARPLTRPILAAPSAQPVAVAMFDLWANGQATELAALGLLWTAMMTVIAAAFYLLPSHDRRRPP